MRERLDLGSDLWKIRAEPKQDGQRLVVQSLFERRLLTHPGLTEAGDHRIETVRMSVGGSMMLAAVWWCCASSGGDPMMVVAVLKCGKL